MSLVVYSPEANMTSFLANLLSVDALKSDTDNLSRPMMIQCKGVGGNIKFTPDGGQAAITLAISAGEWVPCWVLRLWSTGTTATTLIGVF